MSQAAVKATSVFVDQVWRPQRGVVVLLYHRVGAAPMAVDLPTGLFDEQMAWLASQRCTVGIDAALASLADDTSTTAPDPVVVTFDDGTADLVEVALPILCPTGSRPCSTWRRTSSSTPERSRTTVSRSSWAAVREAVSTGLVTIGSHTDTHALLDRIDPAAAAAELDRSRALIEDRVGVPALDFAYPKAVAGTAEVEALVRSRFRSAAGAGRTLTAAPTPTGWPGRPSSAAMACGTSNARPRVGWHSRIACGESSTVDGMRAR